jgi:GxxExxY protein
LRPDETIALEDAGLKVQQEVALPVWFRGRRIATFRADLIVEPGLIVEVKTAAAIEPFHEAQLSHYLKATDLEVGLLLNFGPRPEFSRVVYARRLRIRKIRTLEPQDPRPVDRTGSVRSASRESRVTREFAPPN